MWQHFTEGVRRVILLSQEEAGEMRSGYVGTEHFLLGLIRENEGVAAQVLQQMGISLPLVRAAITAEVPLIPNTGSQEPQLNPKAKRVLELASAEAQSMRFKYIGTEHLLLGLLLNQDSWAAIVLNQLGANLERTRAQIMEHLGIEASPAKSPTLDGGQILIPTYLKPEITENSPIIEKLQALNVEWAAVTRQKEAAVLNNAYQLAGELRDRANEIEDEFVSLVQTWHEVAGSAKEFPVISPKKAQ